jgi:molybdate transport system substrate-binding protein
MTGSFQSARSEGDLLRVMSARALTQVVDPIAAEFSERTGCGVELVFGTVGALRAKLDGGGSADVLVLSAPVIQDLAKAGLVREDSRRAVGSTGIGLAVREGDTAPDIATAESFRATILKARSIAVSDPSVGGSAGVYLAGLFDRLGLKEAMDRKGLRLQSGGEVARCVANGTAEIGLTQVSEMLPVAGIRVVGALPPPLGNDTTYWAAVHSESDKSEVAVDFIAMLTTEKARQLLSSFGFSPCSHS